MDKNIKAAKTTHNKRYTLRRLFGGSGFEKPQSGDTTFVRFCLTHIPAHRFAAQSFIRWAGTSYTVLGWRRFASPNKQMRSICRAGKMWWRKTAQRAFQRLAHARLLFFVTRTAEQAVSANRLLSDAQFSSLFVFFIFFYKYPFYPF